MAPGDAILIAGKSTYVCTKAKDHCHSNNQGNLFHKHILLFGEIGYY
jgi:hypothetical protein